MTHFQNKMKQITNGGQKKIMGDKKFEPCTLSPRSSGAGDMDGCDDSHVSRDMTCDIVMTCDMAGSGDTGAGGGWVQPYNC